jgi:WD40 repeat protein
MAQPPEIKVWDAQSGRQILTLKGHAREVTCMAFSPDGKRLASAGAPDSGGFVKDDKGGHEIPPEPGEIKVWDTATGQEIFTLKAGTGRVRSVCFSPDGKRLVSAGEGSLDRKNQAFAEMKVSDVQSGKDVFSLKGHTEVVTAVAFSPDGNRIVSGGGQTVKIWDAQTGQEILTLKAAQEILTVEKGVLALEGKRREVISVAFSADGRRLICGCKGGSALVWESRVSIAKGGGEGLIVHHGRAP